METIKDFAISSVFILVCSVSLLFFILGYPALNNQSSVLINDSKFNKTATDLSILLGDYQSQVNTEINVSTSDEPTIDAQSLQLVSTVSTSRTLMSRLTGSFRLLTTLLGNVFGLSGGTFALIAGSIISLFGLSLLYLIVKLVRYGT